MLKRINIRRGNRTPIERSNINNIIEVTIRQPEEDKLKGNLA